MKSKLTLESVSFTTVRLWILRRFDYRGLIISAVFCIPIFLWLNWDKVMAVPGTANVIQLLTEAPIPRALPASFTIALAHLEMIQRANMIV